MRKHKVNKDPFRCQHCGLSAVEMIGLPRVVGIAYTEELGSSNDPRRAHNAAMDALCDGLLRLCNAGGWKEQP